MARKQVWYWRAGTRKPRPGIITGTAVDGGKIIRVRHTGEVYGNATVGVPRRTSRQAGPATNSYAFY